MDIKLNQNIFTPSYQAKQKQHAQPIKPKASQNLAPLAQDTVSFSKKKSVGFGKVPKVLEDLEKMKKGEVVRRIEAHTNQLKEYLRNEADDEAKKGVTKTIQFIHDTTKNPRVKTAYSNILNPQSA